MRTTTTVIVGAGHAGLAMSRCLSDRGIDHVLLGTTHGHATGEAPVEPVGPEATTGTGGRP